MKRCFLAIAAAVFFATTASAEQRLPPEDLKPRPCPDRRIECPKGPVITPRPPIVDPCGPGGLRCIPRPLPIPFPGPHFPGRPVPRVR